MCERLRPEEYDEYFRWTFAEPRNCDAVSAQMKLDGKVVFEILREFTDLWKERYTDYAPRTVLEALVSFGMERSATISDIARAAYLLGRTYDVDLAQEHFQIQTTKA